MVRPLRDYSRPPGRRAGAARFPSGVTKKCRFRLSLSDPSGIIRARNAQHTGPLVFPSGVTEKCRFRLSLSDPSGITRSRNASTRGRSFSLRGHKKGSLLAIY